MPIAISIGLIPFGYFLIESSGNFIDIIFMPPVFVSFLFFYWVFIK
jgi:hypothetical protein